MVVFTCNHCGESVHKPKVEKHYQFQCRNFKSLTCVDCFKDFRNEEFQTHTKCLTEDERYAAKGTYGNGIVKKGDVKQESWLDMIKAICDTEKNLKPSLRKLLEIISEYSNVPRKKVKFMNFIKSSSGNRANMKEVEEVWNIIEKHKAKNVPSNQNNKNSVAENQKKADESRDRDKLEQVKKRPNDNEDNNEGSSKRKKKKVIEETQETESNGQTCIKGPIKKGKKSKSEELCQDNTAADEPKEPSRKKKKKTTEKDEEVLEISCPTNEDIKEPMESVKFNYKTKILEILTEKQSISHKKLQKKVLKAYLSMKGQIEPEEKIIKKFNKKLKKIPNVGIEDDRVLLLA